MKHLEIERKFLVRKEIWDGVEKAESKQIKQGYLSRDEEAVIRIRIANDIGLLAIKGRRENISRMEFEYTIPLEEARALHSLVAGNLVEKTRYKINHHGKSWDVDIFHGSNEGLYMAEIELESTEEEFDLPEWAGEEVSLDHRYYNAYLSEHPFTSWLENR
ncbi:MAG: CYTH domain-containing protein [Bacteroidales bacterium]|nr:CYTH domain-containing protein [Bacteroidota bacterium]MBL6949035.1 CYTH domain-containing protein [Bacteroidales bacterium]